MPISGDHRLIAGVMTGTSLDGIDAALAAIHGHGLDMRVELVAHACGTLGDLAEPLRALAAQTPMTAREITRLAAALADRHVETIEALLRGGHVPDVIAVHGQTVHHEPPWSWQLIDPAPIAWRFRCPVVSDLRGADLAAGGQGAPITPIADWVLFRDPLRRRAVVNLGGFCNVTVVPAGSDAAGVDGVRAFDVCVCNQLLDAVARRTLGRPYDEGGRTAGSGTRHEEAAWSLLEHLDGQRLSGRSLGSGDEAAGWLEHWAERLQPADVAASAVAAVAECITSAIDDAGVDEVVVAGGGARNAALAGQLGPDLRPSDALGVPIEAREALAMAVLGALGMDGVAATLPQVTGCATPAPVAGSWTAPLAAGSPVPAR